MRNMIKSEEEVRAFLNRFFPKFDVWGILYINREKNLEALKMLGITSAMRFHLAEHSIDYAYK